MIVSGFNVYPVEVEEVIREVAGVTEAAVIGVEDEQTGRGGGRLRRRRRASTPAALEDAVRAHCEQRLARFKQPSRIEVVAELPVGVTGKVQKGRLRGMERRRALGPARVMSARVTLYSKPGCHLCDDARAVIERVCADLGESYEEISILDDPALLERYGEEIPVTLVDGRQHDFWRVTRSGCGLRWLAAG